MTKSRSHTTKITERPPVVDPKVFAKVRAIKLALADKQSNIGRAYEDLQHKKFPAGCTDIAYRILNHWGSQGLLDDNREDQQEWRKFSLQDIVWVRTVKLLREYGLSLEKIQTVHNSLSAETPDSINLSLAIGFCAKRIPIFIIVLPDGTAGIFEHDMLGSLEERFGYQHYVRICLNHVVQEVAGTSIDYSPKLLPSTKIGEADVIKELRKKDAQEVLVRLQQGVITDINTKKNVDGAEPIMRQLSMIDYGDMQIKVSKGRIVHAALTENKRIRQ